MKTEILKNKLIQLISNKFFFVGLFVLMAVVASLEAWTGGLTLFESGYTYTKYNNYVIFEKSFDHLIHQQDLYVTYLEEHWDLFKYTPTFAVFFGFFGLFPDWLGLILWNVLNAMVLLIAVYLLPAPGSFRKGLVLLIIAIELMTSLQNEQSNGLMAGLLILAFALMERKQVFAATFVLVFSVFIKLFGVVGFAMLLFYPKLWKSSLYVLFWTVVMLMVPLLFTDVGHYLSLFESYQRMLLADHDASLGYSLMGMLHAWFGVSWSKNLMVAAGALVFVLPLFRFKLYDTYAFRYLLLSSILLWIVIFNHKAESPTFVIAMTGVALWYVQRQRGLPGHALLALAIVLTSLTPTDIFPQSLNELYVKPLVLKVLPSVIVWLVVLFEMGSMKKEDITSN